MKNSVSIFRQALRLLGHCHFLSFGLRDKVIRWFHEPVGAMAEQFETNFYGLVYYGSFDTYIDWTVFYYGTYERDELQLMADLLAPIENPTILDIGANVGHHSLFFSTIAARVHAFEPLAVH